jgi:hypothetical protein
MPTFFNTLEEVIAGYHDHGTNFDALMTWHEYATDGALDAGRKVIYTSPGSNPDLVPIRTHFMRIDDSNPHREFHYRFIPVPDPLLLNNPPFNTNIPWRLWNTFPEGDTSTVATLTGIGAGFVIADYAVSQLIRDFEWKLYNIQVFPGINTIDVDLFGDYTQGDFTLDIIGRIVLDIALFPEDDTVEEKWKWGTRVMVAWDSTEQRVRYAPAPHRKVSMEYVLDEPEVVDQLYRLYQSITSAVTVPFFQHMTYITAESLALTDRVYFDPTRTNLRAGDQIYIVDELFNFNAIILTILQMEIDGCTTDTLLAQPIQPGWIICPSNAIYLDRPQVEIDKVTGALRVTGEVINRNRVVSRESAGITLPTFNSLLVLDRKVRAGITRAQEVIFEEQSTEFGPRDRAPIWAQPKLLQSASFTARLQGDMSEYDWATTFFDAVAGQLKAFYMASKTNDLALYVPPTDGSSAINVRGTDYVIYIQDEIYKQLEIEYADGTYTWHNTNTATPQPDGTTIISLLEPLPLDVTSRPIVRVSYLYRVRLATDEVTVKYRNNRAVFSFSVLGTRQ